MSASAKNYMNNKPTKLLAIDTATEQCSAALLANERYWTRVLSTSRGHAELILPMIDELLRESGLRLSDLDGLAFGRGPGSFTGVRIAVGVAQGLALATGLPVIGVSDLAAVAQQVADERGLSLGASVLVCMDARMREVYWGVYRVGDAGLVQLVDEERVGLPDSVAIEGAALSCGTGTGFGAYPTLCDRYPQIPLDSMRLPRAREIAMLAVESLCAGAGQRAADVRPVYLRDSVTQVPK